MTNLEQVLTRWDRQGLTLLPPLDQGRVIAFLAETGKRFSDDVVKLYTLTGGIADREMDEMGFTLWPLGVVSTANACEQKLSDIAFGDVLIDACRYYFRFEDDLHSSVYGGYEFRKLANSIDDFFELYLTDSARLDLHSLEPTRPSLCKAVTAQVGVPKPWKLLRSIFKRRKANQAL
jgi:hypothetical protein